MIDVWVPPFWSLLVGTGIYLTLRLGLLQVLRLPKAFKLIFAEDKGEGDISSFAALATALAATVGTGNIVGGSYSHQNWWTWCPFLDVDCRFLWYGNQIFRGLLAIKFRTLDDQGNVSGGSNVLHHTRFLWEMANNC